MDIAAAPLVIDTDLLRRYGGNGPRYTSYPTADRFVEAFDATAYRHWLANRTIGGFQRPLGLYVHVPFCDTLCFYCACNKISTKDRSKAHSYVSYLEREMELVPRRFARTADLAHALGRGHAHLPGRRRIRAAGRIDPLALRARPGGEYAIEIDPRRVDAGNVKFLARLGFNRVSIGVQDFDAAVQRAVNRVQSVEETRR
jgi:oxygen-independent coproporphyrinogen-3 oxidase